MNKNFENCIIIFMIIGILYFYNVEKLTDGKSVNDGKSVKDGKPIEIKLIKKEKNMLVNQTGPIRLHNGFDYDNDISSIENTKWKTVNNIGPYYPYLNYKKEKSQIEEISSMSSFVPSHRESE